MLHCTNEWRPSRLSLVGIQTLWVERRLWIDRYFVDFNFYNR